MLKVLELFSGTGCQVQALKNIGIECVSTQCEIDKYAIDTYNQLHGQTPNLGDIAKVKVEDLQEGQFDLITYSSPCFVGDSLVLTTKGYKQIKDVKAGDKVITHNGIYKEVLKVFDNGKKDIVKVKGMGFDEIKCTYNHKFYVRETKYKYIDKGKKTKEGWKKKSKEKYFDEPKWIEAQNLKKGYYLGVPLNKNEIIPQWKGIDFKWSDGRKTRHKNEIAKYMNNKDFWWIVGRYLGDGWVRKDRGIIICTAHKELDEVVNVLNKLKIHYNIVKERTTYKIQIPSKEYSLFFEQFGKGAINKHLTQMIFDLPKEFLKSMIEGYLSADGCNIKGKRQATTISRELAYGISYCIMKAYHKAVALYKYEREKTHVIEERIVNQHSTYQLKFKEFDSNIRTCFYENGYMWLPFRKIEKEGKKNVYDIEIKDDHSFTVQNIIVHNCQDFSVAGLGRGGDKGSGTRSSLLFECEKIIRKVKPKYLLFENVKNLLSEKHIHNFMEWLKILEEMGYCSYYDVLNAKDFGIPQNRERIFCVSILGKHVPYVFPQKQPLKLKLKDMLEDKPAEKYYLSKKIQDRFVYNPVGKNIVGTTKGVENTRFGQKDFCYNEKGIMGTLNATDYKQPKQVAIANNDGIEVLGNLDIKGFECCKRVYDKQGISPSITAGGGDHVHKIVDEPVICASRGRYNEQGKTEQQLEINKENTSNTITTVSKDNLVIEPKIERIGGMYGQATRWGVYSDEGISPTITASMGLGGGHVPMVEEKTERLSNQAYETLEENKCKDGDVINPFNKKVVDDGICPTITTRPEGFKTANLVVVDESIHKCVAKYFEKEKEQIATTKKDIYNLKCTTNRFNDYRVGITVSPPIMHSNTSATALDNHFRIRKLTPRECWRLMGWKDEQFDKIKGISNAQLYKMAGNGIVINVLEAIFTNMFLRKPTKEEEKFVVEKPVVQMELF